MASTEEKQLEGVEKGGLEYLSDETWVPTSTVHAPPQVKVTEPSGSFCRIESRFSVSLPPDDVFDIIIDPNNRRVFKNVKEVTYRKVLEDDGNRQLVEVEQLGRWKFLVFSGTFACRVFVEQNRKEHTMHYDLARQGMMKKFQGSWKIEPKYETETGSSASERGEKSASTGRLIGSWVSLQQTVQPALIPPWPLSNYVRGVCGQIIKDVCADLQLEAIRLAELKAKSEVKSSSSQGKEVEGYPSKTDDKEETLEQVQNTE
ncbi:hypothetical protein MPTK1_7g12310 [Marchantia polymorpha subsp. ruderalis]|uniref:DUF220 domain-containing protein n=2 Tax=Marchantia polymorpha TaxID=3197 RepID=A0A176VQW5_MARPO|nr:hypothetical protein AXG93_2035s1670 [Marchantia polymorpha subsp. ruderalis]PTQ49378.1 hypothetical protein MARPO_0003s0242 [Marchantia polymorpha]PTQ49379.1 hypothetical protein MARPO_0003s0242 [Marchantia polymorpha]PTQ49380.1 hypothetical protein MARPO_0003s0242 [Marchantia polymorpha]BBN17142.1 hypothetical protein Mp_7g12310 [Marchantia polymorpha subsp. ruderalis]|eukprot:PTQ49378.1 hypothetical protein MARPO_0003s0242 [Marchantia polymorpha]